jgi:glycosyltransferase involved in cell wall biosynthesis
MFTILLPVFRPPDLLPFAITSVIGQTVEDWELFVICDGAPAATVELALQYAAMDPRIRVRAFPKGERNGELHRHLVLQQEAEGTFIAQLGDDDIWFPAHLSELALLLEDVDFGNLLQYEISPKGIPFVWLGDLGAERIRAQMSTENWNFFGPTVAGYRLEAYKRLRSGWSPAPDDVPSDLFMWRKFLTLEKAELGTRFSIQSLKFAAAYRKHMTLSERVRETEIYAELAACSEWRSSIVSECWHALWKASLTAGREERIQVLNVASGCFDIDLVRL